MRWDPTAATGCPGWCRGDQDPVVTLCPGVAAPPAPLPGHAHAGGGAGATASLPATQLPGADGESRRVHAVESPDRAALREAEGEGWADENRAGEDR